jgi:hypothetical protein
MSGGRSMRRGTSRTRSLALGAALALAYLAVALLTPRITGHHVRPLFEGFTPPPPYRWVNPPKEFAVGNQPPQPSSTDIDLGPTGSGPSGATSEDNQIVLNIPAGGIPPHPPDTKAIVKVTPFDPAKLGPLPNALRPDGNAYRVEMNYASGAPIPALAVPGNCFLIVPNPSTDIAFSVDGRTWELLGEQHIGGSSVNVGTKFEKAGYYLGATNLNVAGSAPKKKGTSTAAIALVIAGVVVLALVVGLAPRLFRRRRPPPPPVKKRRSGR